MCRRARNGSLSELPTSTSPTGQTQEVQVASGIETPRRALAARLGLGVIAVAACAESPSGPSASAGVMAASVAESPISAEASQGLRLVYHATFGNGSLSSGVDPLAIGPMKPGDSQVANTNPFWTAEKGGITLGITRPLAMITGPVGAGLFGTPVDFDQGSVLGLRATFVAPVGPHQTGTQFAAAVGARTGGMHDLPAEIRTVAALQVRANGARLNVVGASAPANLPNMPQTVYDAIFDPVDPLPFTLEIVIDRVSGSSEARLEAGGWVESVRFQSAGFQPLSGPSITAVGVSIAIASGAGETASVHVRDFQIFAARPARP